MGEELLALTFFLMLGIQNEFHFYPQTIFELSEAYAEETMTETHLFSHNWACKGKR